MSWRKILMITMSTFVLAGCASTLKTSSSGFLPDYSQLTPSEQYPDTQLYVSPKLNKESLAAVNTIYLPAFEIWLKSDEAAPLSVNTQHVMRLSRYMQKSMTERLSPYFTVVTVAPEVVNNNVLTVKGAFTDIQFVESEMGVRDFIPIRLVYYAGKSAYLAATEQTEAVATVSLETLFQLGNGEPVLLMSATKEVDAVLRQNGADNESAVKAILDVWIDNFVTAMTANRQPI